MPLPVNVPQKRREAMGPPHLFKILGRDQL